MFVLFVVGSFQSVSWKFFLFRTYYMFQVLVAHKTKRFQELFHKWVGKNKSCFTKWVGNRNRTHSDGILGNTTVTTQMACLEQPNKANP